MLRTSVLFLALLGFELSAAPHHESAVSVPLAPGYGALGFALPQAGSYELPPLGVAADGKIVNEQNKPATLHELFDDKLVVFSFIYTSCSDVNGCPLASYVLSKMQKKLMAEEAIARDVRLVSMTFDPRHDTPEVLGNYAEAFRQPGFAWDFVAPADQAELASILAAYDQFVIETVDDSGEPVGAMSHILRVYLIDSRKRIRNIYSVSFLHQDILINDIKTILSQGENRKQVQ